MMGSSMISPFLFLDLFLLVICYGLFLPWDSSPSYGLFLPWDSSPSRPTSWENIFGTFFIGLLRGGGPRGGGSLIFPNVP